MDQNLSGEHSGIWHRHDGRVWWARQMRWTVACAMDFELMPFDTQRCKARLSDFLFDGSALVPHEPDGSDFVSGKTSIVESSCNDRGKTMSRPSHPLIRHCSQSRP